MAEERRKIIRSERIDSQVERRMDEAIIMLKTTIAPSLGEYERFLRDEFRWVKRITRLRATMVRSLP